MAAARIKGWPPPKRLSRSTSTGNNVVEHRRKIGETAKLIGVEPYVLRFWETQFSFIRPKQSRSRHRYYSQMDVETLQLVKRLLHTEGYTIAGARKFVREQGLDRVRDRFTSTERVAAAGKTRVPLHAASPPSGLRAPAGATPNRIHRELREIREDLRALHKLLDTC
jgi:DNA-binding transcriptional MerR regulator